MIPVSSATHLTLFCGAYSYPSHEEKIGHIKETSAILRKHVCSSHKSRNADVFGMQVSAQAVSGLPF